MVEVDVKVHPLYHPHELAQICIPIDSRPARGCTYHSCQNRNSDQSRQEENQSDDRWWALGVGLEDVVDPRLLSVSLHSVRYGRRTGIATDGKLEGEVAIGVGSSE